MNCPSKLYPECWHGCPDKDTCADRDMTKEDPMTEEEEERFIQIVSQLGGSRANNNIQNR